MPDCSTTPVCTRLGREHGDGRGEGQQGEREEQEAEPGEEGMHHAMKLEAWAFWPFLYRLEGGPKQPAPEGGHAKGHATEAGGCSETISQRSRLDGRVKRDAAPGSPGRGDESAQLQSPTRPFHLPGGCAVFPRSSHAGQLRSRREAHAKLHKQRARRWERCVQCRGTGRVGVPKEDYSAAASRAGSP